MTKIENYDKICELLLPFVGENGHEDNAVEVVYRLLKERIELKGEDYKAHINKNYIGFYD